MAKKFSFRWKLVENYFNALMVIVFTVFVIYALVYGKVEYVVLAILGAIAGPFIATFIDKKSQEGDDA